MRSYGTRAFAVLDGALGTNDLGEVFCADLTAREVDYLMDQEWALTAEDVLFRRSKLNLHASAADAARLEAYMTARRSVRQGRLDQAYALTSTRLPSGSRK